MKESLKVPMAPIQQEPHAGKVQRLAFVVSCFVKLKPTCTPALEISGPILSIGHSWVDGYSGSGLHVLGGIGEGGAVLGGGVLRPVRRNVAQDHHDGPVRVHPLRRAEVVHAFICDDVGEVVLWREQVSQGVTMTW